MGLLYFLNKFCLIFVVVTFTANRETGNKNYNCPIFNKEKGEYFEKKIIDFYIIFSIFYSYFFKKYRK